MAASGLNGDGRHDAESHSGAFADAVAERLAAILKPEEPEAPAPRTFWGLSGGDWLKYAICALLVILPWFLYARDAFQEFRRHVDEDHPKLEERIQKVEATAASVEKTLIRVELLLDQSAKRGTPAP